MKDREYQKEENGIYNKTNNSNNSTSYKTKRYFLLREKYYIN